MKTKEEWVELIQNFNNSDLGVIRWCQENNLNRNTFLRYRKLYNDEALERDGVLNWASVDLIDQEIDEQLPEVQPDSDSIELTVKILTFKLSKVSFQKDLIEILQEVGRI